MTNVFTTIAYNNCRIYPFQLPENNDKNITLFLHGRFVESLCTRNSCFTGNYSTCYFSAIKKWEQRYKSKLTEK